MRQPPSRLLRSGRPAGGRGWDRAGAWVCRNHSTSSSARPVLPLAAPDKEQDHAESKAREPALHKFEHRPCRFCPGPGIIVVNLTLCRRDPGSFMITDTQRPPVMDAAPVLRAAYAPPDEAMAASLLPQAQRPAQAERRIDHCARRLIEG